ncbi:MAG TPA: hypothetical protein VFD73_17170, partial [Gemmatimonadales bacterium]|nr:hypothetical protein [Gemmatimonadales bacterium]
MQAFPMPTANTTRSGSCLITQDQLDAAFQEVLPRVGVGRYFNVDARRFAAQYAAAAREGVTNAIRHGRAGWCE